jgi:hypothetical protein
MSRVREAQKINAALIKKGWKRNVGGKHVRYAFLDVDGKESVIKTMISHGMSGTALSEDLMSKMARQLHLTKQQFLDLIDCRLSEEGYRECLRDLGILK